MSSEGVNKPKPWLGNNALQETHVTRHAHQLVGVKNHGARVVFTPTQWQDQHALLINPQPKNHGRMRNKLGIGLAIGLAVMALAVLAVIPIMAQSILPILPPPGRCWGVTLPTPPPGWHGKPPIWLPQIIVCNFPIHGQPILPPPPLPPHPIPLNQ
jgi:hypothetical protein